MKSYNLKENVNLSLQTIESSAAREAAKTHGQNGVEDLSIVFEYFEDQVW
jgi:hypothetical protein